jgi:hypothetical protein
MSSLQNAMLDFRSQLQKGTIQIAYKGLLDYILSLRNHFAKSYPDFSVSGTPYFGYMDMTYFSVVPENLKQRGLKIAIVFIYDTFRFEVWLAAVNKKIQTEYWNQIKASGWNIYRLVPSTQGYDSIVEMNLVESPDFGDLPALTRQIEAGTLQFIADVATFLENH